MVGHFTFWISPSLSGIAEQNRCIALSLRPQGVIIAGIYMSSNIYFYYYRDYYHRQ